MAKNISFKKKQLNKKDYQNKEIAAKIVKGAAGAAGAAVIVPKIVRGVVNLGKKIIFKS